MTVMRIGMGFYLSFTTHFDSTGKYNISFWQCKKRKFQHIIWINSVEYARSARVRPAQKRPEPRSSIHIRICTSLSPKILKALKGDQLKMNISPVFINNRSLVGAAGWSVLITIQNYNYYKYNKYPRFFAEYFADTYGSCMW